MLSGAAAATPSAARARVRRGQPAAGSATTSRASRRPCAGPGAAAARASRWPSEYLQRVRETGDPAFYARAEALLRDVLAREPRNADALVGPAALALSRHDFRGGLALARRADAGLAALPVTVDALVELGRYGEARAVLQRLADLKPNLATYARVSYLRELHGDLRGAASALALAAARGRPGARERGGDRRPARRPRARPRAAG